MVLKHTHRGGIYRPRRSGGIVAHISCISAHLCFWGWRMDGWMCIKTESGVCSRSEAEREGKSLGEAPNAGHYIAPVCPL